MSSTYIIGIHASIAKRVDRRKTREYLKHYSKIVKDQVNALLN